MRGSLSPEVVKRIGEALIANQDLFAWSTEDMPGVDPSVMSHKLSFCREARPMSQKKHRLGEERRVAVEEEVQKLLEANFIQEVQYTTWLSNIVLVKKSNRKWRMCTEYTDLKKGCPKDSYPLPSIDRLVDDVAGHTVLSFLDAFSNYNQIPMYASDVEKTAFITETTNFCYQVILSGLKNAGATYQQIMDRIFKDQIGSNVEVYVDDMIVISPTID